MSKQTKESTNTSVLTRNNVRHIRRYKVILHNDDYTTFDFVIEVLMQIFNKPFEEAQTITYSVHENGMGIAGIYTREIAEMKVSEVHIAAENAGFPLRASYQPE